MSESLGSEGRKILAGALEDGGAAEEDAAPKFAADRQSESARRRQEAKTAEAVSLFNVKAKNGVKWMKKNGVVDETPEALGKWMYENRNNGLSKRQMGEFLGGGAEYNIAVLESFLLNLNFTGLTIDVAIRTMLREFRLPGESQCIDRIMEKFAATYKAQNEDTWKFSEDAAFCLAFSIIMLNVDLHNPAIEDAKKMSEKGFISNNRGIDEDKDLPSEMLAAIYKNIKSREIKNDMIMCESENATFNGARIAGWLDKGGTHLYSPWHKYWFVLSHDGVLYYFKEPQDADAYKPRCIISSLDTLDVKEALDGLGKGTDRDFVLLPADGDVIKSAKRNSDNGRFEVGKHSELLVRARDHEEQQRWIQVLDSEIKRLRGHGSSMPASTRPNTLSSSRPSMSSSTNSRMSGSSSSGSRPPTLGSPVKEGWMQKRGDINRAWRRRYFALYQDSSSLQGILCYYSGREACQREIERGETTAKGVIMFSKIMAVCEQREAPDGCRVLALATMDRTWLVAMREESWPSWIAAFNTSLTQSNLPVRVEESGRVWTRTEGPES